MMLFGLLDSRKHIRLLLGVLLFSLFGLTDVGIRPVLAAQAPLASDPEKDTKEEEKARHKGSAVRNHSQLGCGERTFHRGAASIQIADSNCLQASLHTFSHSGSQPDPFGNGIGNRLRC
jgi:hypothetical protein